MTTKFSSGNFLKNLVREKLSANEFRSLRALCDRLEVPASLVSNLINSKRIVTMPIAEKVAIFFKLTSAQKDQYFDCIASDRSALKSKKKARAKDEEYNLLSVAQTELLLKWQNSALLCLGNNNHKPLSITFISQKLRISESEAVALVGTLCKANLMESFEKGYRFRSKHFTTSDNLPSRSIRAYHKQHMTRSIEAIEAVPIQQRDFSSVILNLDQKNMKEAKRFIEKMRRKFILKFDSESVSGDIYSFGIQLFPSAFDDSGAPK